MLKKVFRWFSITLGVVLLLVVVATVAAGIYLNKERDQLVADLGKQLGLEIDYHDFEFTVWEHFPEISLAVDSLVLRDPRRPATETVPLRAAHLNGRVSLRKLLCDTLELKAFTLTDAEVFVLRDSTGGFNFGGETEQQENEGAARANGPLHPVIDWEGTQVRIQGTTLAYRYPAKRKDMGLQLDTFLLTAVRGADRQLLFTVDLDGRVRQLAFNTDKGSYLRDTPLSGRLELSFNGKDWQLPPTPLRIGGQDFTVSADLDRQAGATSTITVATDSTTYPAAAALLHEELQEKIKPYFVAGHFPVKATITTVLSGGSETIVRADFSLAGQRVKLKEYRFRDVHASGSFTNQLAVADGGVAGSRKNLRFDLEQPRGYYGDFFISMPEALVTYTELDTRLRGPLRVSGPAAGISRQIEARDFFLRRGKFVFNSAVNTTLSSVEAMIEKTDGRLLLRDFNVYYRPAGVTFPFAELRLEKDGEDIGFQLQSKPLKTGFTFGLDGTVDHLTPLLLDRPGERITSEVSLSSPRIDWTDFLAIFGEHGYFEGGEEDPPAQDTARVTDQAAAMKKALLGINASFQPNIEARFDTVAYYDVLSVADFRTGLRFDRDTLVLERTTFRWEDSDFGFGAWLGLGQARRTPFRLDARADHLNLNRLRTPLEYFGLRLPPEVDSLPRDLNIRLAHRGQINDTLGVQPGTNRGRLTFNDGAADLFSGRLNYEPAANGLRTRLNLAGDPQLVNYLFAAEDFLFSSGRFRIDLDAAGDPAELGRLIETASLELTIDSSRLTYRPAGAVVPIRSFRVSAGENRADYELRLSNDATRRSVAMAGALDGLRAFLYPVAGQSFRIKTNVTAASLHASDLSAFIQQEPTGAKDTTHFDPQRLLSATGGIFNSFRPDLSLQVDTFWVNDATQFTNLHAGVHVRDSSVLVLERSGFTLNAGTVEATATYDLDKKTTSPFRLEWRTDQLDLGELTTVVTSLGLRSPHQSGNLSGVLTTKGLIDGKMNELTRRVTIDSSSGSVDFLLTGAELADWPQLRAIGKKIKMKKRFERLRFAPLEGKLRFQDGRARLARTEVQSTALQLFLEGEFWTDGSGDLLVAVPLRNIGRGVLSEAPLPTGFPGAGWKVYLVVEPGKDGKMKTKFRLGRRRFFKERGRLEELRALRKSEKKSRSSLRKSGS